MTARLPATAIVLAGGRSARFGSDKAEALLRGRSMLDWVLAAVSGVCDEVIIVGGPPRERPGVRYLAEEGDLRGPLGGMVAGMRVARFDACFATACDAPLLAPAVVRAVLTTLAVADADAALPVVGGVPQPLAGAYRRDGCLAPFEATLATGRGGPIHAVRSVRWTELPETALRESDPDLRSFINANTPDALAALEALLAGG